MTVQPKVLVRHVTLERATGYSKIICSNIKTLFM